jgi:LuxR family transcriptional regulator, quorum-sensing system regulator BjaR1
MPQNAHIEWPDVMSLQYQSLCHDLKPRHSFIGPQPASNPFRTPYRHFATLTRDIGFDQFLIAYLPRDEKLQEQLLLTSFPAIMVEDLGKIIASDERTLFEPLGRSNVPFAFQLTDGGSGSERRIVSSGRPTECAGSIERNFLSAINASCGCCIPLVTVRGERAFALLTGSSESPQFSLGDLAFSVVQFFEMLNAEPRKSLETAAKAQLSAREVECMKWVAAGKTSSEIALITSLSEHTVNHYLSVCCRKLDAVNRIQAVAKAVRFGIV